MDKDERIRPGESPPLARAWTRVEDYVVALARLRSASRRRPGMAPRTQPESPRASLSTLPFLALLVALGVMALAIAIVAWPGREHPTPKPPPSEVGTAPPGWFEQAKREMR